MLCNLNEASAIMAAGRHCIVSGSANLISKLPRGNWIGGTTPYLMSGSGNGVSGDRLLVTEMPEEWEFMCVQRYGVGGVSYISGDCAPGGFSIVIVPFGTDVEQVFSKDAINRVGLSDRVIAGWVSGVAGNHSGEHPQVFYGPTGHGIEDEIVALHMKLPEHLKPVVDVINIFEEGDGDGIGFISNGFSANYAIVGGKTVTFSKYLAENRVNLSLPLVATINGVKYNSTLCGYDAGSGGVRFYAPVFRNIIYKVAKPIEGQMMRIREALPHDSGDVVFGCVCIGNYMDGALADYKGSGFEGPVSYGEIAGFLTNQCIVRLRVVGRR
jgi:hypothetical protein